MSFTETLRIRPYQYKSPNGIEATRNLWCLTEIKGDNKWFPCNWKGLIDRIKGYLRRDGKVTKISEEEKKRTIEEWMKILFGPKEERYPEIKKIPEDKEGELLISIMTAMSDQEEKQNGNTLSRPHPVMEENQKKQEKEDVKEKQNERREKPKRDEERESVKQRKREEDKKIIIEIPYDFFQTFIDYT